MKLHRTPIAAAMCAFALAAAPPALSQTSQQRTYQPFDDNRAGTIDMSSTPGSGGQYSGPEFHNLGYTNDEARRLQQALAARGFDPGPIDGTIGPRTRAALRAFQQQRNLAGGFDRQTAYELGLSDFDDNTVRAIDISSTPGSRGPYAGPTWIKPDPSQVGAGAASNVVDQPSGPINVTENIRELQRGLRAAGYDPGPVDGVMGPQTRQALANYQQRNNLRATGTLTRETVRHLAWPRLRDFDDNLAGTIDMSSTPGSGGEYAGPSARAPVGDWGWAREMNTVRNVQRALAERGYYGGSIDRPAGTETQAALIAFQRANRLPATGTLDRDTVIALGLPDVQVDVNPVAAAPGTARSQETYTAGELQQGTWSWAGDVETVRRLQQALSQRGHDVGRASGIMDARTLAALRQFQRQQGQRLAGAADADRRSLILLGVIPADQAMAAGDSGSSAGGGFYTPQGSGGGR